MAQLGFDVNEVKGTLPLHRAAAGDHLDMLKLLIELGANPLARDLEFQATALVGQSISIVPPQRNFLNSLSLIRRISAARECPTSH